MAIPDRILTHQVTESLPPNIAPIRAGETEKILRLRRDAYSTRNAPPSYPRIPRLVSKNARPATSTPDSLFQANASHVQKFLSLIAPNESAEKNSLASAVRRSPMFQDGKPSEVHSSSSSEQCESSGSNFTPLKNERSCTRKRGRRASSPTDSDEDPFHFDKILSSSPTKREVHDDGTDRALSSSVLRRASIVPVDPNAEPAPHRFSLLRERASEETIFVQEICDAEGRRWSLRVPASGLPEDMVHMLEELEKLAVELGHALPKIVVTCSAESLSMKRMERDAATVNSLELLRPPPAVGDESSVGYDVGTGLSLAKEKGCIIVPERSIEEPGARPSKSFYVAEHTSSEESLTCIHLPELAPDFLSSNSVQHGFRNKPAQTIQCARQRAFYSALKEPQPTSSIAKRLMMPHSTKAESVSRAATAAASEVVTSLYSTASSARSKTRTHAQAAKSKSSLPILKTTTLKSPPPQPEILKASTAEYQPQQQAPPRAPDSSHSKADSGAATTRTTIGLSDTVTNASTIQHQHLTLASSTPPSSSSQPPSDRREQHPPAGTPRSVSVSAPAPPTGRKLRHLFRRPPVRSASDPPSYSSYSSMQPLTDGGGSGIMKRPASEVVPPVPREVMAGVVEQRRMPRLPSARDLLRKLT